MLLDLESLLAGLGVEPVGLEATSRDEFDALLDNVLSSTAGGDVDLDLDLELGVWFRFLRILAWLTNVFLRF